MNSVKRGIGKNASFNTCLNRTLTGALIVLAGACLAQAQSPATVTASIPYIAFGGVTAPNNLNAWTTEFLFTNLGTAQATVTFRWYGDSGAPLPVPVIGSGRATTHTFQVAPNATVNFLLDNTQDALTGGWAAVDITGSVSGQAVYHYDVTGQPEYSAAAPLVRNGPSASLILLGGGVPVSTVPAPVSLALPFNNVNNITGVSFANITSVAQTLTLNFLDNTGNLLMSQTIPLGPGAHTAYAASDPRVANTKGTVTVSGDGSPYSAIAFVMGTGPNNGTIATLLPIVQ
jgi:hypothetical protein